jgi:hypothetical protein
MSDHRAGDINFGPSAIFAWPDQTAFFGVP